MWFVKLCLAAFLFLVSLALGLLMGLVGLWSPLAFALLSLVFTTLWRLKNGSGRDHVYFIAYVASLVLETAMLSYFIKQQAMGLRRIMDGYSAPSATQALLALVPLAVYASCLSAWASKPRT